MADNYHEDETWEDDTPSRSEAGKPQKETATAKHTAVAFSDSFDADFYAPRKSSQPFSWECDEV